MRAKPISCCFTGHRPGKLPWSSDESDVRCVALKEHIRDAVAAAYDVGYRHFLCGMAQGSDLYFCEIVQDLRKERPDITVEAAIPCATQADRWPEADRRRYHRLLEACDYETMVQPEYSPGCMQRRNRYMVDHASMLIAVHDGQSGGTRSTIAYAMRRKLDIVVVPVEE